MVETTSDTTVYVVNTNRIESGVLNVKGETQSIIVFNSGRINECERIFDNTYVFYTKLGALNKLSELKKEEKRTELISEAIAAIVLLTVAIGIIGSLIRCLLTS